MSRRAGRTRLDGTMLGARVGQWFQRSMVRSIQRGVITLNGVITNTATITAVVLADSLLVYGKHDCNDASTLYSYRDHTYIELTNATTVTATRGNVTGIVNVPYEVIEFWPGVLRSVQRGLINLSGVASATATIVAVNTAKAICGTLGNNAYYTYSADNDSSRVELANATTVTATRVNNYAGHMHSYQVAEFF